MTCGCKTESEHLEQCPETNADRRGRDGYRLTEADESRIIAAVDGYYRKLANGRVPGSFKVGGDQIEAMRRVGAASIGCGLVVLRDCEIDWLDHQVELAMSPF